jgi:predicted nucleotidyltransferase
MNHGLTATTVERLQSVLAHYREVEKAVLYGSRAKGTYRPGSDIDLTLCGGELNHTLLTQIDNELDDLRHPLFAPPPRWPALASGSFGKVSQIAARVPGHSDGCRLCSITGAP